ncbi:MAG TPA: capsule assembly Wzi family protein [Sphingobacteriaceae bacterium]|nr:capsule assembly Wzi family protein [Sphingobacteriaceae bacterium]
MLKKILFHLLSLIVILISARLHAQSLPVGSMVLDEYYRRAQLNGQVDSTVSFTIRPLFPVYAFKSPDFYSPDSLTDGKRVLKIKSSWNDAGMGAVKLLPVTWQMQNNSHHPYGWNNGSFIPAKGLQSMITAGVYAEYGPLKIQLQPEYVWAENRNFEEFPTDYANSLWARYYDYHYNLIDLPEKFGNGTYTKASLGQSSIRLTFDPVSVGLSNENLWWGPGIRNSLVMSNTAPGFKHITVNSVKPLKTPVGSFEGQMILGRLENSGFDAPQPDSMDINPFYKEKSVDDRYLMGGVLTYQPKWVEGLFIGLIRTSQKYRSDLLWMDYMPFLLPLRSFMPDEYLKKNADQYSSVFARWLFTKAKGELYLEYGRNNHPYNYENSPTGSEHSTAYIFGLRKLLDLNKPGEQILVGLEVSSLQSPGGNLNKYGESWYVDNYIKSGHTNRGEVLGAGLGPGGSSQTLDISWVSGIKKIGLQMERQVHNNDAFYHLFLHTSDPRRHWVDLSAAGNVQWDYKNLLFNANLGVVKSLNYQWYLVQTDVNNFWVPGRDVVNFHTQVGVSYRF